MTNLLNFSADHLKVGGRVVFWVPLYTGDEEGGGEGAATGQQRLEPPAHPRFRLLSTSEEPLTRYNSRVLVCMEKVEEGSRDEGQPEVPASLSTFRDNYFKAMRSGIKGNTGL